MAAFYSETVLLGASGPVRDAVHTAQSRIARALRKYHVAEKPSFHPCCSFSEHNLLLAMEEMEKHLGVSGVLNRPDTVEVRTAWVYATSPQELLMLALLLDRVRVEHLYLGVSVHLATASDEPTKIAESVAADVAATFAGVELLVRALQRQHFLHYLRLDINVLATSLSPFDIPAVGFLASDEVEASLNRLARALRSLLDLNTAIRTFKLGLHHKLFEAFEAKSLDTRADTATRRMAVLLGRHHKAGARSGLSELPPELLELVLDAALPLGRGVEVLPLRNK